MTFNLIDQPWIPCIYLNGTREDLSLRDVFANAHRVREIRANTPLETIAIIRLLLTIMHRVWGPKDDSDWKALWQQKSSDLTDTQLDAYFKQWHHKFDLFDPAYPFFQYGASLKKSTSKESKKPPKKDQQKDASDVEEGSINKMLILLSQDATLFEHTMNSLGSDGAALTPAQAAGALLAVQAFALGYQQFVDGPCVNGANVLVVGDSLCETLVLNLPKYPEKEGNYQSESFDKPAWEHESTFMVETAFGDFNRDFEQVNAKRVYREQTPLGQLDYLTWHNRKIKLLPGIENGKIVVRRMRWAPGMRLSKDSTDPMQRHEKSNKFGWKSKGFQINRAIWRDSAAIIGSFSDTNIRPIQAIEMLQTMAEDLEELKNRRFLITVFGVAKKQAKVLFMRQETIPLDMQYLNLGSGEILLENLSKNIELSEKLGDSLMPTVSSRHNFWVKPFQLGPGILNTEMPIDGTLFGIRFVGPGSDL